MLSVINVPTYRAKCLQDYGAASKVKQVEEDKPVDFPRPSHLLSLWCFPTHSATFLHAPPLPQPMLL